MPERHSLLDLDAIVEQTRLLRREALSRQTKAEVELFAKVALRSRASRELVASRATIDHVHESGLAVRVLSAGRHAGFAASSGLSSEVVRWALATASASIPSTPAMDPYDSDSFASERWDLDATSSLPSDEDLTRGLLSRSYVEWVEAGTTIEVLLGAAGWLAVRRRDRFWALGGGPDPTLVAQRGFAGWHRLLDRLDAAPPEVPQTDRQDLGVLMLSPDAASPVVAALVDEFHGPQSEQRPEAGRGWDAIDEPCRADGLSGGSFDDLGYPTIPRVLAIDGVWKDRLGGPGSYRRASFREPPKESSSNLVMRAVATGSIPERAAVARRCRVLHLSEEFWVLELDLRGGEKPRDSVRRLVKVNPAHLLSACAARLGGSIVTASGPVVPGLVFEGLPVS